MTLLDNAGTSSPLKFKDQQDLLTVENNGSLGLIGPITCSSANNNNFSGAIYCPSITTTGNTTCDLPNAKRLAIDPNEYHSLVYNTNGYTVQYNDLTAPTLARIQLTFSNTYLQYNDYKLRLYGLGAVLTGPLTVNNSDSGSAFKVS